MGQLIQLLQARELILHNRNQQAFQRVTQLCRLLLGQPFNRAGDAAGAEDVGGRMPNISMEPSM